MLLPSFSRHAGSLFVSPLLLLCLLPSVAHAYRIIRSTALLTCMENSQFSANTFDVVFTPDNATINFELNAITTLDGYYVAKVSVIAYGISVITQTVDFCDLGSDSAQVCPLSPGHLDNLKGTFTLSTSVISEIPGVAYTIPDLDGTVRVLVYPRNNTSSSSPVACVEATLSNDKTVQTSYASWALAIITILGFLLAGVVWLRGSLSSSAHIASSIVSLFVYFQGVAIIAMMAVEKCPAIAAAWSQNFMWTVGLVSLGFIQDIMNWYIQATGGTVTSVIPNATLMSISVQKRDAILSYASAKAGNIYATLNSPIVKPFAIAARRAFIPRDAGYFLQAQYLQKMALVASGQLFARNDDVDSNETTDEKLEDYSSSILVLRGMQRVAFKANIEITSLFVTGLTFFLIFTVFAIFVLLFIKVMTEILAKTNVIHHGRLSEFRKSWKPIFKGVLLRIFFMAFPSLTVLCLWEFTQHESVATVVLAAFTYLTVFSLLSFGAYKTISIARRSMRLHKSPAFILFSDADVLNRWGFLYVNFRATAYYFIVPTLVHIFLKGLFIAVAQGSGKVQAICVFLIELWYLVYVSWVKPYMDKTTNGFNIAIAVVSLLNALFFLFFSNLFGQPQVVSSIMAVIFFILNAAFSLILVISIIVSCLWALLSRNPENRYQPMRDDREAFIPDAQGEKKPVTELDALGASARDGFPSSVTVMNSMPGVKPTSLLSTVDDSDANDRRLSGQNYYDDDEDDGRMAQGSAPGGKGLIYQTQSNVSTNSSTALNRPAYTQQRYPLGSGGLDNNSQTSLNSTNNSHSAFPAARLPRTAASSTYSGGSSPAPSDLYGGNTAYQGYQQQPSQQRGYQGW